MLLHELFERQADARPGDTALLCGGQLISYGELESRANRLARLLRSRGIGRGACVGLWLPRSADAYAALLGILKSGAAYVPIDPAYPAERAGFILSDCRAPALVSTRSLAAQVPDFQGTVICLDDPDTAEQISRQSSVRLTSAETGALPNDLCYVIYTSGSTGKPKGVEIEHRSVCHLVRTEGEHFLVHPEDRVYQGFSLAFDASVEEVWLAFFAGATLVVCTPDMERAGAGLARMLADAGVTVLSCVPTLLAMLEEDIPTVRLLILGGEACPPSLVERWWKPTRRMFNTYGPTEATVIATWTECHPQKPVTIGRPLPGYFAAILDEQMRPAPPGVPGELCLGGAGLARGYLGRPELTREKFVANPLAGADGQPERLYRTGDLASWTPGGEIQFLGRIDDQVKIRGFRVELSEIESVLLQCPGIKAVAVALREDTPGKQVLVGYVVPQASAAVDETEIRRRLRTVLPTYMVPALLETLPELPTLPSGKVDRKKLPPPRGRVPDVNPHGRPPQTDLQRKIAESWERLFAPQPVSIKDDFFLDLGGHSLLAARMVSELRRQPGLQQLSMLDVYQRPTIEALAAKFEIPTASPPPENEAETNRRSRAADYHPIPFWRHFLCGSAQLVSLIFVLTFFSAQWLAPYLTFTVLIEEDWDYTPAILAAMASLTVLYPLMLVVSIAAKWLLIGRFKVAEYPLWGFFYFRWWLSGMIEAAVPVEFLEGTPLLNIYLRLMGARIGPDVHLNTSAFAAYDLISIGEGTSVNADSNLLGYTVENGLLKFGRITVGRNCFVGTRAALRENTAMEDDSTLDDLSLLQRGMTISRGSRWRGAPARRVDDPSARAADGDSRAPAPLSEGRFVPGLIYAACLMLMPMLVSLAIFPGIVLMNNLNYLDPYYWYLTLAPLVGLSFIVLLCLEIAAVKWLLLGRAKPGRHRLHGHYFLRKWFVDKMLDLSLDVLGPLYASIFLRPWYRLLGAKVGKGAEVSTASFITPDLLSIGDDGFIADSVSLGAPSVRDGIVTAGAIEIGRRSFIGNSAMLPPGTVIGNSVLIGCLSAPPSKPADALREDTAWLGSPAIFLPQRQKSAAFSPETTFNPTVKLRVQRTIIEFVRVITPATCFIILISLLFSALLLLHDYMDMWQALLFFPFLYLGCGIAATLFTIAAKWLLVWRYRPGEKPLWSTFVWRNELLNALHEHLAEPFLVGALTGTPFVCWYFRLLGARIGRRVYMETTDLSEFDLARIGDETALNADCTMQTHLFEDRVMKMSTVDIAPRCKVGAGSLVLYDTRMDEGALLGDVSLLMKGETLPAWTDWEGIPAAPVKRRDSRPAAAAT